MFNLEFACSNAMARVRGAIAHSAANHAMALLAFSYRFVPGVREVQELPSFSEVLVHRIDSPTPSNWVTFEEVPRRVLQVTLAWWTNIELYDVIYVSDEIAWQVVDITHDASSDCELVATLHSLPRGAAGVQPLE